MDSHIVIDELTIMRGAVTALDAVSARIPIARVTALVGANGSGKTTMLHCLAGLEAPHSGSIEPSDRRCSPARGVALVPQHARELAGLPLTVHDAVMMGRWARLGPWRRPRAVDRSRVADAMRSLGIEAIARRQVAAVSGGQRQRALVAQGIAQDAGMLLLDEPTAAADAASALAVRLAMREAQERGTTVVVATHDREVLLAADHAIALDAGRVVAEGAPEQVAAMLLMTPG